jgi:uncharacterized membrane protein YhaH (DUF805 family)
MRMNYYIEVMKKYAVFTGRARRKEFWMFTLIYTIIYIVLSIADSLIGTGAMLFEMGLLSGVFSLVSICPSIAVTIRRLHDIDRSGWWVLIGLVPLAGVIVLIVFAAKDGQPGSNQYGTNPKEEAIA